MIIDIPDGNSIVKWKQNDNGEWKSAEISDLITAYEERPQGMWIKCGWAIRCSVCHYDMPYTVRNFCPNCGADMREGGAE